MVLHELGKNREADLLLAATQQLDPLDWWARHLAGKQLTCDLQTQLDLAHDYARAGFIDDAIELLQHAKSDTSDLPDQSLGARPLVHYTLGWLSENSGDGGSQRLLVQNKPAHSPLIIVSHHALKKLPFSNRLCVLIPGRPRAVLSRQFVLRPPAPRRSDPALGKINQAQSRVFHRLA